MDIHGDDDSTAISLDIKPSGQGDVRSPVTEVPDGAIKSATHTNQVSITTRNLLEPDPPARLSYTSPSFPVPRMITQRPSL